MDDLPLSRTFVCLTKQYIGKLAEQVAHTPVERYYYPLYVIGKNNGKISQQELADHLLTDKVSIVRVLDALSKDGYIVRQKNPQDKRQHILSITPKAEPWIKEIEDGINRTNDFFFNLVPEEHRESFRQALISIVCKAKDIKSDQYQFFIKKK